MENNSVQDVMLSDREVLAQELEKDQAPNDAMFIKNLRDPNWTPKPASLWDKILHAMERVRSAAAEVGGPNLVREVYALSEEHVRETQSADQQGYVRGFEEGMNSVHFHNTEMRNSGEHRMPCTRCNWGHDEL